MSIPDAPDEDKSPVMINYLLVKLNLGNNSFELFELLQALENTERDEIFKSKDRKHRDLLNIKNLYLLCKISIFDGKLSIKLAKSNMLLLVTFSKTRLPKHF